METSTTTNTQSQNQNDDNFDGYLFFPDSLL
ncbi:hypothetical protein FLLO111716_07045 [Flavobacterium longum]